jgi:hypothetical protein
MVAMTGPKQSDPASERNHEVTAWLGRKRFDEGAFLLRHLEINAELASRFPDKLDAELGS